MTTSTRSMARRWHAAIVAFLMATGLLLLLAAAPQPVTGQASLLSGEEQAVLDYVNGYRAQNGLNPLAVSFSLTESARWMSQDMGEGDYFSHTDSLGRSPFDRMAASGYDCVAYNTWCGENLAAGISTGSETFELWRNSPGHNANMLNPNYVVAGVAAVFNQDSTYGWYWTLDMGGVDESGQAPPTATPESTAPPPTETPSPSPTATPSPSPTVTPQLSATSTPVPLTPSPTVPLPTETVPPAPTETLAPVETPEPVATVVPPVETPASDVAVRTAETPADASGRQFGQAPPTRTDEVQSAEARVVRELEIGWNRLAVVGEARRITETLPVADGDLLAVYAWDQGSRSWRRYLPGLAVLGVNTLTEVGANQTVWILATRHVVVTLSV
jgi:uncharacterized protein YkwD